VASVVEGLQFIAVKSVLAIRGNVEDQPRCRDENKYT
jgi:hypothetical protein